MTKEKKSVKKKQQIDVRNMCEAMEIPPNSKDVEGNSPRNEISRIKKGNE